VCPSLKLVDLALLVTLTLSCCPGTTAFLADMLVEFGGAALNLQHFALNVTGLDTSPRGERSGEAAGLCLREIVQSPSLQSLQLSWDGRYPYIADALSSELFAASSLKSLGIHELLGPGARTRLDVFRTLLSIVARCPKLRALGCSIEDEVGWMKRLLQRSMDETFMVSQEPSPSFACAHTPRTSYKGPRNSACCTSASVTTGFPWTVQSKPLPQRLHGLEYWFLGPAYAHPTQGVVPGAFNEGGSGQVLGNGHMCPLMRGYSGVKAVVPSPSEVVARCGRGDGA
jgi:hypothetical protein